MACGVLGVWADVDDNHVAVGETPGEVVAAYQFEVVAAAEVGAGEIVDGVVVGDGNRSQRCPQRGDLFGCEPVVDAVAIAAGRDEADSGEGAEMERRVGDALVDLGGEFVDVAFTLGQDVDQFGSATVAERLGDFGEPVEQCVLLASVCHCYPRVQRSA